MPYLIIASVLEEIDEAAGFVGDHPVAMIVHHRGDEVALSGSPSTRIDEWIEHGAIAESGSLTVTITEGVTGGQAVLTWDDDLGANVAGVRIDPGVPLVDLLTIDWGDGNIDAPPDISGGFVAHNYTAAQDGVVIQVVTTDGKAGVADPFDVIPEV